MSDRKIVMGDQVRRYDRPDVHGFVYDVVEPYCDVLWSIGVGRLERNVLIDDLQIIDNALYERILHRLLSKFGR